MASFVQMSHQGIGGGIRQAKGKRYQVTVLDAEQGATRILYLSPQQPFQGVGHSTVQRSDFDDGNFGRSLQGLSHTIGIRTNQPTSPQLDAAVVANHGGQYAFQVLMAEYLEHGLPGGATGFAIVDRRGMAAGHQGPTDVCCTGVLFTQAGNNGLGAGPVRYGLDAAEETAFLDEQFAFDGG